MRSTRTVTQGSTFSAGKRISVGNQPLNPKPKIRFKLGVIVISFCACGVLLLQNFESITGQLSRPVTKVKIENQWQSISESEVQSLIGSYMGSGFFDFDVQGVRQELESHPWVRRAAVKKIWPDSVALQLTEEVAIAHWGEDQLLNQYGETFKPVTTEHLASLPRLSGPEATQVKVMEQYRAVNQLFFQAGLRVSSLNLSARGNWVLELNDQIEVTAGREAVLNRLTRFLDFYSQQPESAFADIVSVDLRYDNGIAMKSDRQDLSGVASR